MTNVYKHCNTVNTVIFILIFTLVCMCISIIVHIKDEILKLQWIRKIPNQNLNVTQYSFVCEKTFDTK